MENKPVFIWLSRHRLSQAQIDALVDLGVDPADIHQPGDVNAFSADEIDMKIGLIRHKYGPLSRIVVGVVHPAAALIANRMGFSVAVAENVNRAPEGEKPRFEFEAWHIY